MFRFLYSVFFKISPQCVCEIKRTLPKHPHASISLPSLQRGDHTDVLRLAEGFALVLLCSCRQAPRRVAVAIMREVKMLAKALGEEDPLNRPLIDVMDQ